MTATPTPPVNKPQAASLPPVAPEQNPRPVVALPRQGLPGIVIAAAALLLALVLFVALDAQRRRGATDVSRAAQAQGNAFPSPPPLVVPPEPQPTPAPLPIAIVTTTAPVAPPIRPVPLPRPAPQVVPYVPSPVVPSPPIIVAQPPERTAPRADQPALVVDGGVEQGAAAPGGGAQTAGQAGNGANRAGTSGAGGDDTPVRASVIGNRTTIMVTGTLIPAVLETPIDTARAGLARAVVSEDTRGFDGRRVLVSRGSRLIGEYQADVRSGQNRVLVTWTRLIRSDGVTIRLESPAADPLGGAGVPGHVHSYFIQRFASAVLQSALTVGVNLASRPGNGSVIVGIPSTATNVVGQGLLPNDIRPKITVKQGAAVKVFVARDLDFSGVPARSDGR